MGIYRNYFKVGISNFNMIILTFIDLHEHEPFLKVLRKKAKKCDVILCGGDMSIFENDLPGMIKKIASLGKEVYLIHGNHEVATHVRNDCLKYKNMHFVHKKVIQLSKDIRLFSYGGGGFSFVDKEFEKFIQTNKTKLVKTNILMTHAPPYGTKIDVVNNEHAGCKSIKKYLKYFTLAISGHLHETTGIKQVIGKTLIINPGPEGKLLEF